MKRASNKRASENLAVVNSFASKGSLSTSGIVPFFGGNGLSLKLLCDYGLSCVKFRISFYSSSFGKASLAFLAH